MENQISGFEAGLIIAEYLARGMVQSILVLTPASLVSQWQSELSDKFNISTITTDNRGPQQPIDSFWTDNPESVFVTYHSEILNKLSDLLATKGLISALGVKFDGYLKTTGFSKSIAEKFVVQNGLIRFLDVKPSITCYILCNVAYTANADEKRIGLVSFIINELIGVTPVEIGDALF